MLGHGNKLIGFQCIKHLSNSRCAVVGTEGERERGGETFLRETSKRRGQKPRNLAFCFDTPPSTSGPRLCWLDILLINLSAVGLPWWKIAFGGKEHLVAYAAGTDSEATECQLQITDRTIQQIVYMFGRERMHTHTPIHTHIHTLLWNNHTSGLHFIQTAEF